MQGNIFEKIIKRDGRIQNFDSSKICQAITKAGYATGEFGEEIAQRLTIRVLNLASQLIKNRYPTVEEIQDIVEEVLIDSPYKRTAKAYIIYRDQHAKIREIASRFNADLVDAYLNRTDWQVKENSNMNFSLQGLNNYISSQISKIYWLNKIYSPKIRNAHNGGDFHIHDLGILSVYCVGWDLLDLLREGFRGVSSKIESKPAKHFRSILGQTVNFFYTLQGECYSADTQVLTDKGWKYFWEVKKTDKIFTLNPQTNEIELQTPVRFYEFDYDGTLYHFKSKKIDLLVTPNHNMFVEQYCPKCKDGNYYKKFVKAKDFNPNTHFVPKRGTWKGERKNYFVLPGIKVSYYRHFLSNSENKYETVDIQGLKIPMDDWLKFFGIWLAEGSITLRERRRKGRNRTYYEYQIRICQNKGKLGNEIEEVLRKLPFRYVKKEKGKKIEFVIYNKQLFSYLKQFDKAQNKYIPQEIKNLSKEQLEILFEWAMKGDGYIGNGNIDYYTKSKKLADDIQEIVLKLGCSANIYEKKKDNFTWYRVSISKTKYFKFKNKNITKVKYKGKVYCLEVPNHTLFVRRNGKACWCGNSAGAQAFSNFDTLLSPFIYYDGLSYKDVKQALQEFLFNVNVPTRVGFQCVSEDTEILTEGGWKGYQEVNEGDKIFTFNIKSKKIELNKVVSVFRRKYKGIMYRLKNRIQDQLISPKHRVVRKRFNADNYVLEPIEEVLKLKSPFIVPIAGINPKKDIPVEDEQIKLMAWIISEGSVERKGKFRSCYRISIYQSKEKNLANYKEIKNLLDYFKFNYSEYEHKSLGSPVVRFRLDAESSKVIHKWFGTKEDIHFIPEWFFNLSKRQTQLFLETYLKADGFEDCKIAVSDMALLNDLQRMVINAEWAFTVLKRRPTIGKKDIYVLRIIKHTETYINKVEKVEYEGVIWCPHTKNETIIARRSGKVFITGNTPFTNITLDLTIPSYYANQGVIIGGKIQDKTYKEFKKEQDMFNKAFLEVMLEGDAKGRPFTFPIPTYNITKDFDWDNENLNLLWEITARYGIPYFANFVNSDMKPEDARSMCLHPDEEIVIRRNGRIIKTTIGKLVESQVKEFDSDGWSDAKNVIEVPSLNPENYQIEWVKIKRFLKVKDDILITVRTVDGKEIRISQNHLVPVYTPNGIKTKLAKNLEKNDILLTTRKAQDIFKQSYQMIGAKKLDEKLGYLIGFFVADGNYLYDSRYERKRIRGIQFNFNTTDQQQQLIIKKLVQDIYDYELKFIQDPRYKNSLRGYLYRTDIAKEWIATGIEKYNNIPEIIFNSPLSVIQAFLEGFFRGDGYKKGKEIHINDEGLARDLVILMTLAGVNCTYRKRKNSQIIRIQHTLGRRAKYTNIVVDTLYNRVPQFLVKTSRDKPFYNKNVMPCKSSLDRRGAHTEESIKILNSGLALVKIESIRIEHLPSKQDFYDIELEKNHYFVHSLGNITHNCCRLRIDNRKLEKRGGGLFGASPLTGSIGVVTINMPRIGYLSKTESEFFQRLNYLMELAKESLEIKRKVLENLTERNLYPYTKFYLRDVKKRFGQYWKNHFSTIGLVGMNEACLNFLKKDLGSKEGIEFTLKVLDFMREKLLEFQKTTGNNYNLEATPAESTSYRLAKLDKEKYPDIICANESTFKKGAQPFYTNSTQLPVNFTDDVFEVLELQDEIQTKYTGGTTLHIFIGEKIKDPQMVKKLIKNICDNYRLPYFTITPTFSICPQHGYINGEHQICPECGNQCEIYSRVVGYLRPVSSWNEGKQEEFKLRKTFKVKV